MGSLREHLRTKVTPDLQLTYSRNWGNLGLVLNDKKWNSLYKIICCGDLLEMPRGGVSNRQPHQTILWRTSGNYEKIAFLLVFYKDFMSAETFT